MKPVDDPVLSELTSKGYWRITLRPVPAMANRLTSVEDARAAVKASGVESRGWPFPMYDDREVHNANDHIFSAVKFNYIREYWRYYLSGQFVYYFGFTEDWHSETADSRILGFHDAVGRPTECVLFARDLATRGLIGDAVNLEVILRGVKDRQLFRPESNWMFPSGFRSQHHCKIDEIRIERQIPSARLLSDPLGEAAALAKSVLERFDWSAYSDHLIPEFQKKNYGRFVNA